MKTLLAALLLAVAAPAFSEVAADPYSGFARFADGGSLKPFARDLGSLLGSATFHSGRSLGFSGFDVGVRYGAQFYPSKGNSIMRDSGVRTFGLPWVQAEIGMPFKIDGFIRGISSQGLTVAGGGVRYGLYSASDKPWAPQVLLSGVAHSVVHEDFTATHFGANLVLSAGTPAVTPYVAAGFDRTRLVARASLKDPLVVGTDVTVLESRFTAGLNVRPFQFAYLALAGTYTHAQAGAEASVGVRF